MVAAPHRGDQISRSNPGVTRHNLQIAATVSPLTALVRRIDRDSLAAYIFSGFREDIPGYARLPDSVVRGEIVHVIRENLDLCLGWVAGGRAPAAARFEIFRASAKNRAAEGMPLEDVLRAYRVGGRACWRGLGCGGGKGERGKLPRAGGVVMGHGGRGSGGGGPPHPGG